MKHLIFTLRALHPPLFLGVLVFIIFSWWFGSLSFSSFWFYLGIVGTSLFFLDAVNRYSEYKRISGSLMRGNGRKFYFFLEKNKPSWCTREMAKAAALRKSRIAYRKSKVFYRRLGFRWFHFFPVGTFQKDSVWIRKNFWKKTLFSFLKKRK